MSVKSILVLWLSLLAGSAMAENARLPYRLLYNAEKARAELNGAHTNLVIVLTMRSVLPNVKPAGLDIYIDSKAGKIPVPVGALGEFDIPMRDDLLAEDAWLVTNQPKGTMELNWQYAILAGTITKSVHYAQLLRPVRESEEVQNQLCRFFPGSPRQVMTGLKLGFRSAAQKPVAIIHAAAGDRKLVADEHGEIILPLEPALLEQNPEISFSDIPATLEVVSHKAED